MNSLTNFALLLLLLQILVIKLHVEAVRAVKLATLRVIAFNRCVHDLYTYDNNDNNINDEVKRRKLQFAYFNRWHK